MTGRHTRRWFASIPITGRFYIMLAILVLAEAGLVAGCLHAMNLQTEASADLARVAAVQRSLDRALTLHGNISAELQIAATTPSTTPNSLVSALRAQLDLTWALPANAEVAAITDSLRTPGSAVPRKRRRLRAPGRWRGWRHGVGVCRPRAAARRARNRDCAMR